MATTYELTTEDLPLRLRQAVWSEQVDGFGATPRDPSLASLHANPAHSALRRARHFHEARRSLGLVQGIDPRCLAPCGHLIAYQFAEARAMWSVR